MKVKVSLDTLDEIFRFTNKPQFVLYFKRLLTRQTMRVLYKGISIDSQARKGNLQTIKYLHLIGSECTTNAMNSVSEYGYLEVLRYLHETVGCECTTDAL